MGSARASQGVQTRLGSAGVLAQGRFRAPFSEPIEAVASKLAKVPESAGIYVVADCSRKPDLYVGEALILRNRLQQLFKDGPLQVWRAWAPELTVRFYTAASETPLLLANQRICVRQYEPLYNLPERALS